MTTAEEEWVLRGIKANVYLCALNVEEQKSDFNLAALISNTKIRVYKCIKRKLCVWEMPSLLYEYINSIHMVKGNLKAPSSGLWGLLIF